MLEDTVFFKELMKRKEINFVSNISKIAKQSSDLLTRVPTKFSNFTDHSIKHSYRVAEYMADLLPKSLKDYSSLEITIMLCSALLHDIGMCIEETESDIETINSETIRKEHHIRSADMLDNNNLFNESLFRIDNESCISFKSDLKLIVRSHGEDIEWVQSELKTEKILGKDSINFQFISLLLRLGDLLDFDSRRTPQTLLNFLNLHKVSKNEWEKNIPITNYKKISDSTYNNSPSHLIFFEGETSDSEIYREILKYFDWINDEIKNAILLSESYEPKYKLNINPQVANNVTLNGAEVEDMQYKMEYDAIAKLFMSNNLYLDKKYALRELIQNSYDACTLKKSIYKRHETDYNAVIKIKYTDKTVSIIDNGIGMTKNQINNYFLNIGHSYYNSNEYRNLNYEHVPISNYGIGFLSSFLLSDRVIIKTKSYEKVSSYYINLKKDSRYVILKKSNDKEYSLQSGTEIIFDRNEFEKVFESSKDVEQFLHDTFMLDGVKLQIDEKNVIKEILGDDVKKSFTEHNDNLTKLMDNIECYGKCTTLNRHKKFEVKDLKVPLDFTEYIFVQNGDSFTIYDRESISNYIRTKELFLEDYLDDSKHIKILQIYPLTWEQTDHFDELQEYYISNSDYYFIFNTRFDITPITIYLDKNFDSSVFEKNNYISLNSVDSFNSKEKKIIESFQTVISNNCLYKSEEIASLYLSFSSKMIFSNSVSYKFIKEDRILTEEYNLLYLKNVAIPKFEIKIPYLMEGIVVSKFFMNIKLKECFPNIDRTQIDQNTSKKLGYALGRAIHIYFLQSLDQNTPEYNLMTNFIETYYKYDENNKLCRNISHEK